VLGSQTIFSFDIYLGQRSICRGGFNVTPIQIGFTFKATDGTEFVFSPAYGGGAECDVEVSHMREGQLEDEPVSLSSLTGPNTSGNKLRSESLRSGICARASE
jgi:hypothetical protein